jgi:hypothetical protein
MKKLFTLLSVTFFLSIVASIHTLAPSVIFAATASKSATPSTKTSPSPTPSPAPTSDEATTQNLKDRIQKALEKHSDQVQGVMTEIGGNKKAIVGEVQRVTEKTVTIKNIKGSETLTIDPKVILVKDAIKISIDDIAVGDWAIALGYREKDSADFELHRLVISSTSLAPKKFDTTVGTVKTNTKTQIVVTPRGKQEDVTFTIAKATSYQDGEGNTIKREDIKTNTEYIIVSNPDTPKTITIVHAIP